jgi:hypothetical protein
VAATVAVASGGDPNAVAGDVAAQAVTGRFSQPREIADLVVPLASDRPGTSPVRTSSSTQV